jgi:LuxR family maltose regulon positive regulatory protein
LANNHLAQIQVIQGHLNRAGEIYRQTLQNLSDSKHPTPLLGMIRTGIGNILCERNDLENALEYITQGIELGKIWNNWETLQPGYFGLARIKAARGDIDAAIESIKELDHIGAQLKTPGSSAVVGVYRARLLLRKGDISEAQRWLGTTVLDFNTETPYLREPEAIAQSYVLAALGKLDESLRLSEQLLRSAQKHQRQGRVIEILVLRALTLNKKGNTELAIESIAEALKLAEPENYMRIFLDEGQPMIELLNLTISKGVMGTYSQNLLRELKAASIESMQGEANLSEARRSNQTMAEPLSEREFEALQLLGQGLTNQEIAKQLFVSLNTIKTHVKNIHTKLGTRNRTEATTRAQELGLLEK